MKCAHVPGSSCSSESGESAAKVVYAAETTRRRVVLDDHVRTGRAATVACRSVAARTRPSRPSASRRRRSASRRCAASARSRRRRPATCPRARRRGPRRRAGESASREGYPPRFVDPFLWRLGSHMHAVSGACRAVVVLFRIRNRGRGVPDLAASTAAEAATERILTPEALDFVLEIHSPLRRPAARAPEARAERRSASPPGELPDFLPETRRFARATGRSPPTPPDLQDRRVEITGPVDRKMMINALNSGASVFMADFEDAISPTWANLVDGQANLHRRGAAARSSSTHGRTRSTG